MLKKIELKEIEIEFDRIMKLNESNYEKNVKLSELMSAMEREYNIPALQDKKWEEDNKHIISMYQKIARSRKFV